MTGTACKVQFRIVGARAYVVVVAESWVEAGSAGHLCGVRMGVGVARGAFCSQPWDVSAGPNHPSFELRLELGSGLGLRPRIGLRSLSPTLKHRNPNRRERKRVDAMFDLVPLHEALQRSLCWTSFDIMS